MPSSVKTLGNDIFEECPSLKKIKLPSYADLSYIGVDSWIEISKIQILKFILK